MENPREDFTPLNPEQLSAADKELILEAGNAVLRRGDGYLKQSESDPDSVIVDAKGEVNALLCMMTYKELAELMNSQDGELRLENFQDDLESLGVLHRFQ